MHLPQYYITIPVVGKMSLLLGQRFLADISFKNYISNIIL